MSDDDIPIEDKINALKGALRWREEVLMLRAENDRLREALKPFADAADQYDPDEGDDANEAWSIDVTIGDLRRARAALAKEAGKS
jgi:hypothetical protein